MKMTPRTGRKRRSLAFTFEPADWTRGLAPFSHLQLAPAPGSHQITPMNLARACCVASLMLLCGTLASRGQTVQLQTNYFRVSGTNFHEIRRSLAKARPWREEFDAMTRWQVTWKFSMTSSATGCRCAGFSTAATIVMMMPRWAAPTNATVETKERWREFSQQLTAHEVGHARIALAAHTEVRRQLAQFTTDADCAALTSKMNDAANRVLAEHREQEKDYDRRTRHGTRPADR
ncbi:MAG TPA: DUF922 domain-containing protein [Candidatus Acidoferrum sp.]|nr:DUF922 domain-containing protein [Candidatus Acidoferrum sp.]